MSMACEVCAVCTCARTCAWMRACVCEDAPLNAGEGGGISALGTVTCALRGTLPCGEMLQTLLKYGNVFCPAPSSPKPVPGEREEVARVLPLSVTVTVA